MKRIKVGDIVRLIRFADNVSQETKDELDYLIGHEARVKNLIRRLEVHTIVTFQLVM